MQLSLLLAQFGIVLPAPAAPAPRPAPRPVPLPAHLAARFGPAVADRVLADLDRHRAVAFGTPEHARAMRDAAAELAAFDAARAATPQTRTLAGFHVLRQDGSRRGHPARPAAPALECAA